MERNGMLTSIRKRFDEIPWPRLTFRSNRDYSVRVVLDDQDECQNKTSLNGRCQCCGPIVVQIDCTNDVFNIDPSVVRTTTRLEHVLKAHTHPESVHELHLTNSAIDSIPSTIVNFVNLKVLDLRNNSIQELPLYLMCLRNLEVLDLSFNFLEVLPNILGYFTHLKSLILKGNNINALPTGLLKLENLQVLDVSENDMISPPISDCLQGKEAIFRKLRLRNRRTNIWSASRPWYEDEDHKYAPPTGVKDLQEICIMCILECRVDFLARMNVAPGLKSRVIEVQNIIQSKLNVNKCSQCNKFFSNSYFFENHFC